MRPQLRAEELFNTFRQESVLAKDIRPGDFVKTQAGWVLVHLHKVEEGRLHTANLALTNPSGAVFYVEPEEPLIRIPRDCFEASRVQHLLDVATEQVRLETARRTRLSEAVTKVQIQRNAELRQRRRGTVDPSSSVVLQILRAYPGEGLVQIMALCNLPKERVVGALSYLRRQKLAQAKRVNGVNKWHPTPEE